MKKYLVIFMMIYCLLNPDYAVCSGFEAVQLERIAATLKLKLTETIKLVREATVQSKTILEMRDLAINMKRNYDFVRNFRMETYIEYFKDELRGITLLDNLEGQDWERQFDLVMREIDNRFTEEEERTNIKHFMSDLKKLYTLKQVKANENAAIARGEQNQANNLATLAVNTGLMVINSANHEQREITKEQQDQYKARFYREAFDNAHKTMGIAAEGKK